jgi:hypothetical protein
VRYLGGTYGTWRTLTRLTRSEVSYEWQESLNTVNTDSGKGRVVRNVGWAMEGCQWGIALPVSVYGMCLGWQKWFGLITPSRFLRNYSGASHGM